MSHCNKLVWPRFLFAFVTGLGACGENSQKSSVKPVPQATSTPTLPSSVPTGQPPSLLPTQGPHEVRLSINVDGFIPEEVTGFPSKTQSRFIYRVQGEETQQEVAFVAPDRSSGFLGTVQLRNLAPDAVIEGKVEILRDGKVLLATGLAADCPDLTLKTLAEGYVDLRATAKVCYGESKRRTLIPERPFGETKMKSLQIGNLHACAIDDRGAVQCQSHEVARARAAVPEALSEVGELAVGPRHTCAVQTDGAVSCWPRTSSTSATSVPAGLEPVMGIATSRYQTCVIAKSHKVECWGHTWGQVPDNHPERIVMGPEDIGVWTIDAQGFPRSWQNMILNGALDAVKSIGAVQALAPFGGEGCAVRKGDGLTVCWVGSHLRPAPDALGRTKKVVAGEWGACGIRSSDNGLVCWNGEGIVATPLSEKPVLDVAMGNWGTCAVEGESHKVRCW